MSSSNRQTDRTKGNRETEWFYKKIHRPISFHRICNDFLAFKRSTNVSTFIKIILCKMATKRGPTFVSTQVSHSALTHAYGQLFLVVNIGLNTTLRVPEFLVI
jgi:hypothetical protein